MKIIITESQLKRLLSEDDDRLNQILDKINTRGIESLNNREKAFLYGLNRTDTRKKTEEYDHRISVTSDKSYNFRMVKKLIEHRLNEMGIECQVSINFMGLGLGIVYEIDVKNYFLYKNNIINFLIKNGFKIYGDHPINDSSVESLEYVEDNLRGKDKNYDTLVSPNHGYDLTIDQEINRIRKILKRNGISNYFMQIVRDGSSIKLTLPQLSKDEKDTIYTIISNSGYDIILK